MPSDEIALDDLKVAQPIELEHKPIDREALVFQPRHQVCKSGTQAKA
ncbi:hypothetical protein [Rhizobium freirei]|nr:hypothetical protein [Rhizobium freirei]